MQKKFLNDMVGFFVLSVLALTFMMFLILSFALSYTVANPVALRTVSSLLYGSLSLSCLIWLILRTELIFIDTRGVKCVSFVKKSTTITYCDVTEIVNTSKITYGLDGCEYDCWQIKDSTGKSISIIKTKKRVTLIGFIQSQIKQ